MSLTLDTPTQVGAFAAAGDAFAALAAIRPTDPRALAAIGTVVALLAPSFAELADYLAARGLPPIPEDDYLEMLNAARGFALTVATAGKQEH